MSFVHCPSCQRAFDLRRQATCLRCAARNAQSPPARAEAVAVSASAAGAEPDATNGATTGAINGATNSATTGATGNVKAKAELAAEPALARLDQRIVALVAELSALVERASSAELLSAQRLLAERALPALAPTRWLGRGERRAAALAADVTDRVAKAVASPRRQVARLARGLRAAWSGLGSPPA